MQPTITEIEEFLKEQMNDADLIATQKKISGPRIQEYHKKLIGGEIPPPIKVENRLIVEGHHRYISGMMFGKLPEKIPWTAAHSTQKVMWKDMIVDTLNWE